MIVTSPVAPITIPVKNLADYLLDRPDIAGDKLALINGDDGARLRYSDLRQRVDQLASGLQASRIKKGQVIALYSPNHPDYAVAFLAIAKIGAVVTTINPAYTAEELTEQLRNSKAHWIFTTPDALPKAEQAARDSAIERVIVFCDHAIGSARPISELLRTEAPKPVSIDPRRDLVALPYSSGTTGLPKGVMLSHYNLVANLEQIAHMPLGKAGFQADSVVVGVLPFFHIYGMVAVMLHALAHGACVVSISRFDFEHLLTLIDRYRIDIVRIVPPIAVLMAKEPIVEQYRLDSIKSIMCGAAPLADSVAEELRQRLPHTRISQGYGMTELSPVSHMNPDPAEQIDLTSIGPPLPNTECVIADLSDQSFLGPNQEGELWVRGPQVMQGYLNNPEASAQTIDQAGWLHTGDIARYDERGYFVIVDRLKELIKYKGYQIAPAELEARLLTHPAVADAAIVGAPDATAGEIPKAYVVLKPDADETSREELIAFAAKQLAPYKRIRALQWIDAIPKSPSGKILRRFLVSGKHG